MTPPPVGPAARYFDDLNVGDTFTTQGRTITETDGTLWAMFTGDMNPMHVDEDFAAAHGPYDGRFPPGLMSVAIASGLNERLGLFAGTGLVMFGQTTRYRSPVHFGDTITVLLEVLSTTPHPRRAAGTVEFAYRITKADGTVCVDGEWTIMLASRQ